MRPQKLLIGILLLVSIAGNAILYFKYRNRRPIITVNGSTITYKDLVDYLQLKEGVQVKAQLVERVLIKQEAEKLKCWPTEAEVTEEYNHQKMMDWQFARDVTNAPWQEGEKKDIIRYNFARHALMTKGVQISEEQLKDEYNLAKPIYDTPTMIKCNMGILFRSAPVEEVKKMLEKKNPVVSPQDIQRNFSSQMMFIGDNQVYTIQQPFGINPSNSQVNDLLQMKPGEVRVFPALELANVGGKNLVVRLLEIIPGKAADLNDPKVKEKMRQGAALRRSKPWQETLIPLWTNAKFDSVDPMDHQYIEMIFFPDRATAQTPRQ